MYIQDEGSICIVLIHSHSQPPTTVNLTTLSQVTPDVHHAATGRRRALHQPCLRCQVISSIVGWLPISIGKWSTTAVDFPASHVGFPEGSPVLWHFRQVAMLRMQQQLHWFTTQIPRIFKPNSHGTTQLWSAENHPRQVSQCIILIIPSKNLKVIPCFQNLKHQQLTKTMQHMLLLSCWIRWKCDIYDSCDWSISAIVQPSESSLIWKGTWELQLGVQPFLDKPKYILLLSGDCWLCSSYKPNHINHEWLAISWGAVQSWWFCGNTGFSPS